MYRFCIWVYHMAMIPKEYQRLQLWIRLNNRVLVDMLKKTPAGEWWNKAYLRGGRHIVKQLARQWAYDVKQARRQDEEQASRN